MQMASSIKRKKWTKTHNFVRTHLPAILILSDTAPTKIAKLRYWIYHLLNAQRKQSKLNLSLWFIMYIFILLRVISRNKNIFLYLRSLLKYHYSQPCSSFTSIVDFRMLNGSDLLLHSLAHRRSVKTREGNEEGAMPQSENPLSSSATDYFTVCKVNQNIFLG